MTRGAYPVALTIAGSDPGGGAGLQMDMKVFSALGAYAAGILTAITVQNSAGVGRVRGIPADLVEQQLKAVLDDFRPTAMKTGMLWSAENARAIARQLTRLPKLPPLVVDPVIWAGDGTRLLSQPGVDALTNEVLPLATLVTPNRVEAEHLCKRKIRNTEEARLAAEKLIVMGAKSALIKGGHLKGEVVDVFFDGRRFIELRAEKRRAGQIHGTGCALSAGITAYLAKGLPLG
ncbi:MAG: bifunctional hydroxymethylpyrimidine kinase/phosphomethylpyrimidine kinase, partial [Armatimonadetes bacterium]|nr:bifunctional hydroxymethylpyrimidine kinase/phosphomethylpyrimidine kinase [Armatimonadota bacterium]NIM23674.1 bifunctional hydroxymethylpyrimidine kinase/phosphomethylpyrimidine kinase [Armatimonadota bacterium]NIM67545.1 bifunctional hydroxymethylpyrimidine kinase/phosphomethylpyrimidine kinase [Armatimonadota bacterium]NIM76062.1 bifunctional hydroxymethylpyrimidine kinase/phosphomethylpyrimidine kinase [Armatimonadota bacterium]NIN05732.1 bifunctional hydroxymethylpyrimidine kinase/phos